MAASKTYAWKPLPDPLEWTRVFVIQPDSLNAALAFSLYAIEIAGGATYECASRTRGVTICTQGK